MSSDYFADFNLVSELKQRAHSKPDNPALTAAGGATLTYAQLDAHTDRLAHVLAAAGVGAADRVAILDKSSVLVAQTLLAAAKIGAVLLPLNWRLSGSELTPVISDAQPRLLIVHRDFAVPAAELGVSGPGWAEVTSPQAHAIFGDDYRVWVSTEDREDPESSYPGAVALLYTSGSTGAPKGVVLTHQNLGATSHAADTWSLNDQSTFLCAMPMFHIGGLSGVLIGIHHGTHVVVVRETQPGDILSAIAHYRISHTFLVPTVISMLLDHVREHDADVRSLRCLVYGASPSTPDLLRRAHEHFGPCLIQVYGLTETSGAITELLPDDHVLTGPRVARLRSAGRPYPWVRLRTADPATGEPLPDGATGEILVHGPGVTVGYHRRPEETARALTKDGWLRTGDIGYIDADGYLTVSDRAKDMIITGGENVYPAEIEAVIAEHPAVKAVAVIGVPDSKWGEAVHAVVVVHADQHPDPEDLRQFCRDSLSGFKCPKTFEFRDELPLGPTGKVSKPALRAASNR